MSEARRATLIPFAGEKPGDRFAVDEHKRPVAPCIRLTFVLPESNEGTCPVYNFKEELAAVKKKEKLKQHNGKTTNGLDPFDEDDDDVIRIAREMEAKYGNNGPPAKKKRKGRRDDYADIGMGYDESDSFIDNTDGYDEIIPQNVTTLHGGFYINCGALEFKTDEVVSSEESSSSSSSSSTEDEEDDDNKHKESHNNNCRKRVLETSSEGECEPDKADKVNLLENEQEKEREKDKEKPKPEKKLKMDSVVNGLPVKKKKESEKPVDKTKKVNSLHVDEVRKKVEKESSKQVQDETEVAQSNHTTSNKEIFKTNFTSVAEIMPIVASNDVNTITQISSIKSPAAVLSSEGENSHDSVERLDIVQLPENLPANIMDIIRRVKESVQKNKENNKDIFSGAVNTLLITFERKSKVLGKQSRSRIYQHMASIMRMKKEILCKHAKNLVMDEDTKRLSSLLKDLKSKVLIAMPQLIDSYEQETLRIAQLKTADSEENKNIRMPKRKFPWNEEMRKMLREIIVIKKRLLIYEGKTKESIEIHLNLFIKSDVHVLWPDGWMTMAALFKLCNSFEKKQLSPNNSNIELNSSSEAILPTGNPAATASSKSTITVKPKEKKAKIKETKVLPPQTNPIPSKELHKFQINSVSICPLPKVENLKVKPPITLNSEVKESDVITRISKQPNSVPHRSTIQARTILKDNIEIENVKSSGDRQTKFVNLSHKDSLLPENLTKKLSTDYNIENIISKKSESVSKQNAEILIPKEENISNMGITGANHVNSESPKIPLENFMPRPFLEVKKECNDDVIVLDDNFDDAMSGKSSDVRRRPGPKSKTKYCDSTLFKSVKCASNPTNDRKIIKTEALKDKRDPKNDGDDILQLMENLKELNKMSTPSKNIDTSPSSAVSVIAYNKKFAMSPTSTSSSKHNEQHKSTTDFSPGLTFHDVYQRQFLSELKSSLPSSSTSPTTTLTKTYNSALTSASSTSQDSRYNTNNNYSASGGQSTKLKNNFQHTGSFNLMDDMLENFITEYAYPKTGSSKQKPMSK